MEKSNQEPTNQQLKENIQKYTTDFNIEEFNTYRNQFGGTKEGIEKIKNCSYVMRCVKVGCELGFVWPIHAERFLASFVCGPCNLYEEKPQEKI